MNPTDPNVNLPTTIFEPTAAAAVSRGKPLLVILLALVVVAVLSTILWRVLGENDTPETSPQGHASAVDSNAGDPQAPGNTETESLTPSAPDSVTGGESSSVATEEAAVGSTDPEDPISGPRAAVQQPAIPTTTAVSSVTNAPETEAGEQRGENERLGPSHQPPEAGLEPHAVTPPSSPDPSQQPPETGSEPQAAIAPPSPEPSQQPTETGLEPQAVTPPSSPEQQPSRTGARPSTPRPPVRITSVVARASSELASRLRYDYGAHAAFDGDPDTAWGEGVAGRGAGEWLEADLGEEYQIERIVVATGYDATSPQHGDLHPMNSQIRRLVVLIDGVRAGTFEARRGQRTIEVGPFPAGRTVRLVADAVWPGNRWADLHVSEVSFFVASD